jgi:hypothetical protein
MLSANTETAAREVVVKYRLLVGSNVGSGRTPSPRTASWLAQPLTKRRGHPRGVMRSTGDVPVGPANQRGSDGRIPDSQVSTEEYE